MRMSDHSLRMLTAMCSTTRPTTAIMVWSHEKLAIPGGGRGAARHQGGWQQQEGSARHTGIVLESSHRLSQRSRAGFILHRARRSIVGGGGPLVKQTGRGAKMRLMRVIRALFPVLGLILVFQGAVAVLPHDHGAAAASAGDALVAPSTAGAHGGCLACFAHSPAAVCSVIAERSRVC